MSYPVGWDLVSITGTYIGRDGNPCVGSVTLSSPQLVLRSGTIVPAADIVFDLVNGTFSGQIPATDDPNAQPSGWVYTVTENVPGGRQGYQIVAPHTSPGIDLSTVVPVTMPMPPTFGFPYVTLAQLAGTAVGDGAYLIGYQNPATGSVSRTVQSRLQDIISVKDFGATGNGTTDDTAAFNAALAYLATALGTGLNGARLKIPAGKYKLSASLVVNAVGGGWNVILSGDGPAATVLDFTTAPAGSDGIRISGAGNFFGLEDFMIQNAPNHGVFVGYGLTVGGGGFASDGYIRNVTSADHGGNGFNFTNLFMFEMASCLAFSNAGNGIAFNGFHTSCSVTRCWARNNTLQNWSLNGMAYSSFIGCGADQSGTAQGYTLSNMRGVVFNGCGAESNQKDGWLLFTSTASTTGLLPIQQDIHGVVFVSCNAFNNSLAVPGAYGTVATITTANSRNVDARWIGGVVNTATSSDLAFILAGNSGSITQYLDGPYYENVATADTATGVVTKINSAVIGLNAMVQLASAQSIPNNANTVVTWSSTFVSNTLNCTYNGSTNGIVIPVGVNRIRVSCGIDFNSSSNVGVRQLFIRKNGSGLLGLNSANVNAPAVGDGFMSAVSAVIPVAAGDYITALVFQNSGGALNLNSGSGTWLSVEAVG